MANKTIVIGKNDLTDAALENAANNEVYKDVSMSSEHKFHNNVSLSDKKIGNLVNVNAIKNSLHQIFTWIPGERILLPEFGSNLRKLLYEGITDFNVDRIMAEIRHCISEWEPRVQIYKVVNASNVDDTEDNTVHIEVLYTIPGLTEDQIYSEPLVFQKH